MAIFNLSISAKYFGVSIDRDVWLLALNAVIILDVAIWAPINDTFRAKFLFTKADKGEAVALQQTGSLLLFINLTTIALVAFIMVFPSIFAKLLAPSYDAYKYDALIFMIRVVAPTFLLNQVSKILISVLNTYNSFVMPEIGGLFIQFFTFVVIVTLAPKMGIMSLAISYYAGLLLFVVLLILQLRKHKINLFQHMFRAKLKLALPFFAFSLPFFLPHFVSQLNLIVEKSLAASTFTGAVSMLDYARKFIDVPLDVLIGILVSLLVPVLTVKFAERLTTDFVAEFLKIYQFGFLIIAVIVGMFTGCSDAIVDFLYNKGNISAAYLLQISNLTRLYSWCSLCVFLYHIFGVTLIATNRGKLFAFYGVIAHIVMIGINLLFFRGFGTYVFPVSLGLSHLLAAIAMSFYFPVKDRRFFKVSIKYALLVASIGILMYVVNRVIVLESALFIIILNMIALSTILLTTIFVGRFEERNIIRKYLGKVFA